MPIRRHTGTNVSRWGASPGLLAALAALAGPLVPAAGAAPVDCRVPGLRYEARCDTVRRALDPGRPDGPRIDIHFLVVPAVARRKAPDPVFLLAGGPGQSAIDVAGEVLPMLERLHNRHDLVFVDQRGTGRSAPLACPDAGPETIVAEVDPREIGRQMDQCERQLERLPYIGARADLGLFTTTLAMQDLDAVRSALGADQVDLIGVSYGTRAALEYQRQFPQHLRRAVLDGPVPPDMVIPQSAAIDNQAALDALWRDCEADSTCHGAYPRLRADWAALKAAMPETVLLKDPQTGAEAPTQVTQATLMGAIRAVLYSPLLSSALPAAITAAAAGRFEALFALASTLTPRQGPKIAAGMHFAVVCAEDYPLMAADGDPASGDFGDAMAAVYRGVCAHWPRAAVPPAFYAMPLARSPVLILSGGIDPMTPPRHAAHVAHALGAYARPVVVPNAGHGVLGLPCIGDVVARFIEAAGDDAALDVDARCAAAIPRPLAWTGSPR